TDFLVCSSYKWLLSTHGVGILGVKPTRTLDVTPFSVGWRSVPNMHTLNRFKSFKRWKNARRFELGFLIYPTIYALKNTTEILLNIGINKIEDHILSLGKYA